MENKSNVICPKCGTEINVSEILYQQIQKQLKTEFEAKAIEKENEIQKNTKALHEAKERFLKEKESYNEQIAKEVSQKLASQKTIIEKELRDNLTKENEERYNILQKELNEKSAQLKELNKTKAEIEKIKREKDELKEQISLEKEKEYGEKLKDEKLKIKKQIEDDNSLKLMELEKKLKDQTELAEEMKRKAEQGSMQLQGEVQELAIEEILRKNFPIDEISEVAKGIKGADVIHVVKNKFGNISGKILYESKRTKAFTNEWINKLKTDAIATKADICVIVTEALPEGIERIGYKEGVWICTFFDLKGLVLVLRDSLIKINDAFSSQTNKGDKMQMLYDYLTSNEFNMQISAILEGFTELQNSYTQEKRAMERIWKQREKQLEKVLLNTNHFIGSVQGIAGNSIPSLKQIGASDNIIENE